MTGTTAHATTVRIECIYRASADVVLDARTSPGWDLCLDNLAKVVDR